MIKLMFIKHGLGKVNNWELSAFYINAACGSNRGIARKANFIHGDFARARILNFFYLIRGWPIKPFVSDLVVKDYVPNAFLPSSLILFTGSSGYNKAKCNNYMSHSIEINKLITGNCESTAISLRFTRKAGFCYSKSALTTVFDSLNFRVSRLCVFPNISGIAANFRKPITVLTLFLFAASSACC